MPPPGAVDGPSSYAHGSATEVATIEKKRVLRAGRTHKQLQTVLVLFSSPADAYIDMDRLG